jgi:hypothetical protein
VNRGIARREQARQTVYRLHSRRKLLLGHGRYFSTYFSTRTSSPFSTLMSFTLLGSLS